MSLKICAIVVTYNRKELLLKALYALYKQTKPVNRIIVVDNASTDGSYEYVISKGYIDERLIWWRMDENTGGAGGFCEGIEIALKEDCDYIWLMDDDGAPEVDCLEKLLKYRSRYHVIGPLVLWNKSDEINDQEFLSFPFRKKRGIKIIETRDEFEKIYPIVAEKILFPFNGTLFPQWLIRKIGAPKREYFIWGDEVEYVMRVMHNGYSVATITEAKFRHPRSQTASERMFFGITHYNNGNTAIKRFCYIRNMVHTCIVYRKYLYAIAFIFKSFWYYTFTRTNARNIRITYDAVRAGLRGEFGQQANYLKD